MRTPIIAGNWKMHKTIDESVAFVKELAPKLATYTGVERVVAPTFLSVAAVAAALKETAIKVSAQNVHWEDSGAFTSQVSPMMLKGLVEYVIIGHSECRAYLDETNEGVNKKAKALLAHGLKPIIAVGESLAQNEAGETHSFVGGQVRAALNGISAEDMGNVVIAYEPIWAIGTGKSASSQQANDIIAGTVRASIRDLYGDAVADSVRIQYGGSVKPNNMADYMSQPDIDGALVGGAALKVDDFTELVRLAAEAKGV
ncbi:MAG: triose-phosphate isomerase [Anaerolineae bacterium]|nr:triose-phosphate isomerase [Anaerolineae bacterium]MDQ7034580.1 triose-phosphate isomerase [Anaerolineae bacterium]